MDFAQKLLKAPFLLHQASDPPPSCMALSGDKSHVKYFKLVEYTAAHKKEKHIFPLIYKTIAETIK